MSEQVSAADEAVHQVNETPTRRDSAAGVVRDEYPVLVVVTPRGFQRVDRMRRSEPVIIADAACGAGRGTSRR